MTTEVETAVTWPEMSTMGSNSMLQRQGRNYTEPEVVENPSAS